MNKGLTYVLIFALVLLICYVLYYIITMVSVKHESSENKENKEKFSEPTIAKRNKIIGFFMSGCPYCVQFKPVFDNVLSDYIQNEKFNKDWSVSTEDDTRIAKTEYNITSFPSVVIIKNGKVVEVKSGSMKEDAFRKFVKSFFDHEEYV